MSENIEQKIISIVSAKLNIDKNSISKESKFVDDLGADSLDLVEVMMAIEDEFECDITDNDAATIFTIEDAVRFVTEQVKA